MQNTTEALQAARELVAVFELVHRPGAFTKCKNCACLYYEHNGNYRRGQCDQFADVNVARERGLLAHNEKVVRCIATIIDKQWHENKNI